MYEVPASAAQAFWLGLRTHMREAGLADVPDDLSAPQGLAAHWRSPGLLLSQTCGYPFATILAGDVRYVGTPCYAAEGCDGPTYRSLVVVRADDPARSIEDLRGRRAAFNERGSQSGTNALRAAVAPLARAGRFFGAVLETGAHRASLDAVRAGTADVAAIDCVTYALLRRHEPARLQGVRVLGQTSPSVPGLPLITSLATPPDDLERLRDAFRAALSDPALAEVRAALLLEGFVVLAPDAYAACTAMERRAIEFGYPELA